MVNTGKPSRGCYMCRARRIKCDEGKPSCMRCQKSKRVCPGYRDAFELKLRDQSKSTKKKHNREVNQIQQQIFSDINGQKIVYHESYIDPALYIPAAIISSNISHSRSSSLSTNLSQDAVRRHACYDDSAVACHTQHLTIRGHMTTPIDEQAACYFLANFVLIPEASTNRGYFDFVIPLLKQNEPAQHLLLAFSAVSLAALGVRPNSKALLPRAGLLYLNALNEINSALRDPKVASSDSILASVMLMSCFEQLIPSRFQPHGWASHVDGAAAVVKSRGVAKHKWQSKLARDIFTMVRATTTVHCISRSKALNPTINWLAVEADDKVIQSYAALNIKMAALRADTNQATNLMLHLAENTEKVLRLLRRAKALDQEYLDWIKALPAIWEVKTVAWVDGDTKDVSKSPVYPGRVDAYAELWMVCMYNNVRACRMLIWTTILRCVAWLVVPQDYRRTLEYVAASRICRQLIEDIVASVPYCLGWNGGNDGAMKARANYACGINDDAAVKPLKGVLTMWSLFVAATSDFATPLQRRFLRGRQKHISETMGIHQALCLLQIQIMHPSHDITRQRAKLLSSPCRSVHATETINKEVAKSELRINGFFPKRCGDEIECGGVSRGGTNLPVPRPDV